VNTLFPVTSSSTCTLIESQKLHAYSLPDPDLVSKLKRIREGIQNRTLDRTLFHPRLPIQEAELEKIFAVETEVVGQKHEVSDYRLWALHTEPTTQVHCPDEPITIEGLYGYPLQFAYWIQSSGDKNLGRFFLLLVHDHKEWRIGAFRFQQWTYLEKNAQGWLQEAQQREKQEKNQVPLQTFFALDVAQKLIAGEALFTMPAQKEIQTLAATTLSQGQFETQVQQALGTLHPVYMAPALSPEGHALLLRFVLPQELAAPEIRKHCEDVQGKLRKAPAFAFLRGVRCGYLKPQEPHNRDGIWGSVYVGF